MEGGGSRARPRAHLHCPMRLTSRGARRRDVAPTFGEGPRLVPAACGITLEGVNSQVKLREFVSLCLCHLLAVPQFLTCEIKLSPKASVNCPMEGAQNTTRYGSAGTRLLCRAPLPLSSSARYSSSC